MRLQKFLSAAGVASRRAAERLIAAGRVKVNGTTVKKMGFVINPAMDIVEVDNRPVRPADEKEYILLNKPAGFITTLADPYGRPTVAELVKDCDRRVFPVGRLDMNTSGLLLLTDDGELAHRLAHPSYGVEKEYIARVKGQLTAETLRRLAEGIKLADGITAPAVVRLIKSTGTSSTVSLTLKEGRKRQVRRMLEAVGHPVIDLKRVRFGGIKLSGLEEGHWRRLTGEEIKSLKELVGLM